MCNYSYIYHGYIITFFPLTYNNFRSTLQATMLLCVLAHKKNLIATHKSLGKILCFHRKGYGTATDVRSSFFSRTNIKENINTEIMWTDKENTKKKKYL